VAFVLDTSAILAVLLAEPGYEPALDVIEDAERRGVNDVLLAFISLMEIEYRLLRDRTPEDVNTAIGLVEAWPATIIESDPAWRRRAAAVKARGGLSLADAWIAALAIERDATLVHKDPEFERVPDLRTQLIS
jgi:predicted nucleic acid-binding protein